MWFKYANMRLHILQMDMSSGNTKVWCPLKVHLVRFLCIWTGQRVSTLWSGQMSTSHTLTLECQVFEMDVSSGNIYEWCPFQIHLVEMIFLWSGQRMSTSNSQTVVLTSFKWTEVVSTWRKICCLLCITLTIIIIFFYLKKTHFLTLKDTLQDIKNTNKIIQVKKEIRLEEECSLEQMGFEFWFEEG